jgi:hypothetical protein
MYCEGVEVGYSSIGFIEVVIEPSKQNWAIRIYIYIHIFKQHGEGIYSFLHRLKQ